jgi:hypothetical protein
MWTLSAYPRNVFPEAELAICKTRFVKGRKFHLKGVQRSHTKRSSRNAKAKIANVNHTGDVLLGSEVETQIDPAVGVKFGVEEQLQCNNSLLGVLGDLNS